MNQSKTKLICTLRSLMDERGINNAQLSRDTGIAQNSIRALVKNNFTRIDKNLTIKLCDYFGCNVADMFTILRE
jgi:putative transcriptional regulator